MAISAANFSNRQRWQVSPGRWGFRATFTGPASYTSGGETLTNALCLAALGLSRLDTVQCSVISGNSQTNSSTMNFDHAAVPGTSQGKFHIYDSTGAAASNVATEVAAAANYGAFTAVISGFGS